MSAIVGPIAPYSNVPINPQYYNPSRFVIDDLVRGVTTTVTATTDMDYFVGQIIRLLIPEANGSFQLNNAQGIVISLPSSDSVEIDIDSSHNVDAFIAGSGINIPQILAIGDINSGKINSSGTMNIGTAVPGSFINVS